MTDAERRAYDSYRKLVIAFETARDAVSTKCKAGEYGGVVVRFEVANGELRTVTVEAATSVRGLPFDGVVEVDDDVLTKLEDFLPDIADRT